MRTNHSGVTEKAEFNIDRDKYGENYDRIFGKKEEFKDTGAGDCIACHELKLLNEHDNCQECESLYQEATHSK